MKNSAPKPCKARPRKKLREKQQDLEALKEECMDTTEIEKSIILDHFREEIISPSS